MPTLLRKKKAKESLFKYIFSVSHLWLGLISSLVLIVVCLTGSILAFEGPIKRWVNQDAIKVEVTGKRLTVDSLHSIYNANYNLPAGRITVPAAANEAVNFFAFNRQTGERASVYIDPYTGKITGQESKKVQAFFSNTLRLHRWLLVRGTGKAIVGISTVIFLFLLLSGIVLWWPKRLKQLKHSLKVKTKAKFYRVNYDLHSVVGFYAMIGLFFLGATGLYFSYPQVRNGVKIAFGADPIEVRSEGGGHQHNHGTQAKGNKNRSGQQKAQGGKGRGRNRGERAGGRKAQRRNVLQKGYDLVSNELTYGSDVIINLPGRRSNNYRFQKKNRDNTIGAYLPDFIELNGRGRMLKKQLFAELPLHEKVTSIMRPMHTGEIAGWPSMILYFVLCLIGTSLPITGFVIWYKREVKTTVKSRQTLAKLKPSFQ